MCNGSFCIFASKCLFWIIVLFWYLTILSTHLYTDNIVAHWFCASGSKHNGLQEVTKQCSRANSNGLDTACCKSSVNFWDFTQEPLATEVTMTLNYNVWKVASLPLEDRFPLAESCMLVGCSHVLYSESCTLLTLLCDQAVISSCVAWWISEQASEVVPAAQVTYCFEQQSCWKLYRWISGLFTCSTDLAAIQCEPVCCAVYSCLSF